MAGASPGYNFFAETLCDHNQLFNTYFWQALSDDPPSQPYQGRLPSIPPKP